MVWDQLVGGEVAASIGRKCSSQPVGGVVRAVGHDAGTLVGSMNEGRHLAARRARQLGVSWAWPPCNGASEVCALFLCRTLSGALGMMERGGRCIVGSGCL